jgi:phage major head subunit gpT-like protein
MVGATDNPLRGWTDDMTIPDFASQPLVWLMMHTKGPIKPFSRLMRIAPDLIPRTSPNDPIVFDQDKLLFGSRARFGMTYSLPFLASISGP